MVNSKFFDLFQKDSVDKQLRIEFDGGVITNEELHNQQFELTESLSSESELRFGSCEASSIKFKISNIFTPLKDKWLTASMTLNGNTIDPFLIGKYKVFSDVPTADRRSRDVVAYDAMYDIPGSSPVNIKSRFFSGIGKRFWAYASVLLVISELLITSGVLFVVTSNEKKNLRERYVNKTENMYYAFDVIYQNLDTMTEDLITNTYIQQSLTDKNLNNYDYEMIQRTLFCLNNDYISYYYYFDNQDNVYTQKNLELKKDEIQNTKLTDGLKNPMPKPHSCV